VVAERGDTAANGKHGPWAVAYNPWAIAHDFLLFGYKAQYGMADIVIAVTALEVFKLPLQSVPVPATAWMDAHVFDCSKVQKRYNKFEN